MILFYYDEVKYNPPQQDSFWLGGIGAPSKLVAELEEQVNEVSQDAFGSSLLRKNTEFHGKEICRGNGLFKGVSEDVRLSYLERLLAIIARDDIFRIHIEIRPGNITTRQNLMTKLPSCISQSNSTAYYTSTTRLA